MPSSPSADIVLRHINHLVKSPDDQSPTDAVLLREFVRFRGEAAFAELVRRHGPMVLGVGRRVLGNSHDAEDVFQATFLVLARKAVTLRTVRSLSAWLHEVALRLAHKARGDAAWRRLREPVREEAVPSDPLAEMAGRELLRVLDDELHRLPEQLRLPLLLCHLKGLTQDEAARELGWSKGTLRRRLDDGRVLLRVRLSGRGLGLPALFGISLLRCFFAPPVRAALVGPTVRAALDHEAVTRPVAALAGGSLLSAAPLLRIAAIGVLLVTGAIGFGWVISSSVTPPPDVPPFSGAPELADSLPQGAVARLGTTRLRSPRSVHALAFTSDGAQVITADFDNTIRFWDVATGRQVRALADDDLRQVTHLAVTPDGRTLLAHSLPRVDDEHPEKSEKRAWVQWDLVTGKKLGRIGGPWAYSVAVSPDGQLQASVQGEHDMVFDETRRDDHGFPLVIQKDHRTVLRIHGVETGAERLAITIADADIRHPDERGVVFSPDGNFVAVGGLDEKPVTVWSVETGRLVFEAPAQAGHSPCCVFSPDGKCLAVSRAGGSVWLCELEGGSTVRQFRGDESNFASLAISPDGRFLFGGGSGDRARLRCWDVATGAQRWTSPVFARHLAVSPDGRRVAAAMGDGVIHLLDAETGKPLFMDAGADGEIWSLAFSPDGRTLASSGAGGAVHLWDLPTRQPRHVWRSGSSALKSVGFLHDGAALTVSEMFLKTPRPLRYIDPMTGRELATSRGRPSEVTALADSPGGRFRVTADAAATVRLTNARGELIATVRSANGPVDQVAVNADGTMFAAFAGERWQSWKVIDGVAEPMGSLGGTLVNPFHLDGRLLLTNDKVMVVDPRTAEVREVGGPLGSGFRAFAFSPDGALLATAELDDRIRLWDVASGRELACRDAADGEVSVLAISADGKTLASAHANTVIVLWDLTQLVQR